MSFCSKLNYHFTRGKQLINHFLPHEVHDFLIVCGPNQAHVPSPQPRCKRQSSGPNELCKRRRVTRKVKSKLESGYAQKVGKTKVKGRTVGQCAGYQAKQHAKGEMRGGEPLFVSKGRCCK